MEIYLAPLQGMTDWIFRESFCEHLGQFDKWFSPFIRVQDGDFFRPSQCKDILPEQNTLQRPIPQFLGNDSASFARFEALCVQYGYTEANINLGCPFAKVANKGFGAGLLSNPNDIAQLLTEIFAVTSLKLSIKCRLGQDDVHEFEPLIAIFNSFPLVELIIHPRTAKQLYKGELYYDEFAKYAAQITHPVCYNGDIKSKEDVERVQALFPVSKIMIGRGALSNPFLLSDLRGETITHAAKIAKLRGFHQAILERCKLKYSGDSSVLHRFVEMWEYHADAFEDGRKIFKQVKKCNTVVKYEKAIFQAINSL